MKQYRLGMQDNAKVRFLDRTTPPHIFTLISLTALSSLAMNMFLPSLPGMAEYFDAPYTTMQLTVALYLFVSAGLQIIVGPLSDKYGRRPIMLAGLLIFVLATIGCLVSQNVYVFLTFRMMQAGVVVAMVLSRATIRDIVPADKAASKIGYVTMGMAVAPMIAPAVGGYLDELYSWQASFSLFALLGGSLLALVYFDQGETKEKSDLSIVRQFAKYPELLRSRRFWAFSLTNTFSAGCYFAFLGGGPFVGAEIYGMSAATLGLYFAAPSAGYFLGNFLAGRYSTRFGMMRMMLAGCWIMFACLLITLALFLFGYGSKELFFFFGVVSIGIGNGMTIPNATSGFISVKPHLAGAASGLGGAIMIGGGATISAIAGSFLDVEAGVYPVLLLMLSAAALGLSLAIYAKRREDLMGV